MEPLEATGFHRNPQAGPTQDSCHQHLLGFTAGGGPLPDITWGVIAGHPRTPHMGLGIGLARFLSGRTRATPGVREGPGSPP